jgi:2-polyprenyl-6-methoxyphenol hydroxylase-like FAD-dependent oxidoreductase
MTEHAVVVVGGGPTGMMLGAELTMAGTDVLVVERRETPELESARAGGLHARTLEVLDQRGVVDRFLAEGRVAQTTGFGYIPLDISDFPTRFPHGLALWQQHIERILAGWVDDLGVPMRRGHEVVGISQDDDGVDVEVSDGTTIRAQYLVGCDGGRSLVRRAAGIDFPGLDASASWLIAEFDVTDEPPGGILPGGGGVGPVDPQKGGNPYRAALREARADHEDEATLEDLRATLVAIFGTDFGARNPTWISRFTDAARQAASYRSGRVLLAGDAAHVHSPHGGQGLNLGVQDAVNLGWKLARVVNGTSADAVLDTYHHERHPVGARVLQLTMAQVALTTPDERHAALVEIVRGLLGTDQGRIQVAAMVSGLDIHYDLGGEHPLVGRRMPDLDLRTDEGATRVFELLHEARPVLLLLGGPNTFDVSAAVKVVTATHDGAWQLPVIGEVPAPAGVLIRPDGHAAWAGDPSDESLRTALTFWFSAHA